MPRPKSPSGYPTIFSQLLETVFSTGQEFHHECTNKREAELLRFNFYAYIKTLRRSPMPREKELAEQATGLIFKVRENVLVIGMRDDEQIAQDLQKSLDAYIANQEHIPASSQSQSPITATAPKGPSQDELLANFIQGKGK